MSGDILDFIKYANPKKVAMKKSVPPKGLKKRWSKRMIKRNKL